MLASHTHLFRPLFCIHHETDKGYRPPSLARRIEPITSIKCTRQYRENTSQWPFTPTLGTELVCVLASTSHQLRPNSRVLKKRMLLAADGRESPDGAGQSRRREGATTARFGPILRASNPSLLPQLGLILAWNPFPSSGMASCGSFQLHGAGVSFGPHARPYCQVSPFPTSILEEEYEGPVPITHRHPTILEAGLGLAQNGPVLQLSVKFPLLYSSCQLDLWDASPLLSPAEGHRGKRSGEHELFLTLLHLGNRKKEAR